MQRVTDINDNPIGHFDGISILDHKGMVLYRIIDNEIYAPVSLTDLNNQESNSALLGFIGKIKDNTGLSIENEFLFKITSRKI
jgi:hypothetical protein